MSWMTIARRVLGWAAPTTAPSADPVDPDAWRAELTRERTRLQALREYSITGPSPADVAALEAAETRARQAGVLPPDDTRRLARLAAQRDRAVAERLQREADEEREAESIRRENADRIAKAIERNHGSFFPDRDPL